MHLILHAYVWPCRCFYQALFADQFMFGRTRSSMADSSWWPSSLDSWSCSKLDFYQQHNCSWYICFYGWQGICNKNMMIIYIYIYLVWLLHMVILITLMLEVQQCQISKIVDMKLLCQWLLWGLLWALPTESHRVALESDIQWAINSTGTPFSYNYWMEGKVVGKEPKTSHSSQIGRAHVWTPVTG